MDIYYLCIDAHFLEFFASHQSLPDQMSGGKYRYIFAFIHEDGFTDFKGLIGRGEDGNGRSPEAKIYRTHIVCNGKRGGFSLVVIAGIDDHHSGQHFHQADVFKNLMRSPILAQSKPGMRGANLYILAGISDALANLIIDSAGREIRKSARERNLAANGQSGSDAHHICLRNAHLEEAIRELLFKGIHLQRACEIGTKRDDIGVLPARSEEHTSELQSLRHLVCR